MKKIITIIILIPALFFAISASAQTVSLSFFPAHIIQGEPMLVYIDGINDLSAVKKLTFDGKEVGLFMYQGKPSGLIGVALNKTPGTYELSLQLGSGSTVNQAVSVGVRQKVEMSLGIPGKLGGNTKASQNKLVASLNIEAKTLSGIITSPTALWTDKFIPPLKDIFVTNAYGVYRKTGLYSIPHKGTDYRAKVGTPVLAINRGIVRFVGNLRDYGRTIVIDHGEGVISYYLHLSKYQVKVDNVVNPGQVIALSGQSGYTLGPHLHLSIEINHVSIDPEKFFALFQ